MTGARKGQNKAWLTGVLTAVNRRAAGVAQEIKAKEMEELAKTLAELGIAAPAVADEEGAEAAEEKRKKKKKDKKPKATEVNGEVPLPETNGTAKENEPMEEPVEEESTESLDPAEVRLSGSPGCACKAMCCYCYCQHSQVSRCIPAGLHTEVQLMMKSFICKCNCSV